MTPALREVLFGSAFYPGATLALDFMAGKYRVGMASGGFTADLASLPGLTVTRASVGYAERVDGTLVQFASGVARITDKGLLVEEARTNLALQSQGFDLAAWTKTAVGITADSSTAPDGTPTADTLTNDGTSSSHTVASTSVSVTSGTTYTISAYARPGTTNFVQLGGTAGGFGANVWGNFDLSTGTVGTVGSLTTASITRAANGWYRVSITGAATATTVASMFVGAIPNASTGRGAVFAGSESATFWGAQLEVGAFSTSYIPTTSASATRAFDLITLTGAYPSAAFTLLADWTQPPTTATSGSGPVSYGPDGNNRVALYAALSGVAATRIDVASASIIAATLSASALAEGSRQRMLAGWDGATYYAQSAELTRTGASSTAMSALTMRLGSVVNGTGLNSYLRGLFAYPRFFSAAERAAWVTP